MPEQALEIPEHDDIPADEPEWIDSQDALLDFVEHVRDFGRFGFDTEFIGEETYFPRTCLIQGATTTRLALVDPFEIDPTPIWELIVDPDVQTITHAGLQDLEPADRLLDRRPANLFDLQIAAAFLGDDYPCALEHVIARFVGADLGHGLKFSQWDRRPLSESQRRYASNDVRYLVHACDEATRALEDNGNLHLAEAACAELLTTGRYRNDPRKKKLKVQGLSKMSHAQRHHLRELVAWREDLACELDVSPRALVHEEAIARVIVDLPTSTDALASVKGMPRPFVRDHGEMFLDAVREQLEKDVPAQPRFKRLTDREKLEQERLWGMIQGACLTHEVSPRVVVSRARVESYYLSVLNDRDDDLLEGWRAEILADVVSWWTAEREAALEAVRRRAEGGRQNPS